MLHYAYKHQMQDNFTIFPPPEKLTCWIDSLVLNTTNIQESQMRPEKSKLEHFTGGKNFYKDVKFKTLSSRTTTEWNKEKSSMRSRSPLEIMNLERRLKLPLEEK